jgi:hypothetical protein
MDMVEEFNRGIQRSMAADGSHCLFPNVMPWSHILHSAAYTVIATETGCRVHDVDCDADTGECLIVAGADGGLCKTLSSSRQLLHLKCVTAACRSRCDIPGVEHYSQALLHQLHALADTPPLGIGDAETAGIVDSILACDTCSVLAHTLLLLPLDVPATVSTLVRHTTALLHRATVLQAVAATLRDASPSLLSAAARVCVADIGTGASAIFPLLGARRFGWSFLALDSNADALHHARARPPRRAPRSPCEDAPRAPPAPSNCATRVWAKAAPTRPIWSACCRPRSPKNQQN